MEAGEGRGRETWGGGGNGQTRDIFWRQADMRLLTGCGERNVKEGPAAAVIILFAKRQKTKGRADLGCVSMCWRKIEFTLMC